MGRGGGLRAQWDLEDTRHINFDGAGSLEKRARSTMEPEHKSTRFQESTDSAAAQAAEVAQTTGTYERRHSVWTALYG
ncbi:hypothetical protein NPX13_g10066 [Xylaria arbuscula]|uniref:Uncharacterized protein n=1 Tax=Xylaria arbuscula TaxID=114810 RepID=A0A9W8TIF4_9PEZI|nr:hypothetical protein NPX13_g10066 [Xylaria arbuscula]